MTQTPSRMSRRSLMRWDSEKLATYGLVVLVSYVAIAAVLWAASKPLWFDELVTVVVAHQPTVSGMLDTLRHVDAHPLPFYVIEHAASAIVPNERIGYRLPSVLALCLVVFCVFVFVRRRSAAGYALIAAVVPLVSILYMPYAVEARGYALMSASVAVALVCYQKAYAIRWAVFMGLSLAAASAWHYYGVFALAPFALAEAAFLWKTRQLRWGVWFGIACGLVPLVAFRSVVSTVAHGFGGHYWRSAQPTLAEIVEVYGSFFKLPYPSGLAIAAVAALGVLEAVWPRSFRKDEFRRTLEEDEFFHERVLVLGLLALPFLFCLAMRLVHGGLVDRYVVEAVLGFSLATGCILPRLQRRSVILFATFLGFAFLLQEGNFWVLHRHNLGRLVFSAHSTEEMVKEAGHPDLPVVVSNAGQYVQFVHYFDRQTVNRYVAVVDPPASLTYAGTDLGDRSLIALRPYAPVQVYQFSDFAAKYQQFLLYSNGDETWDWWPTRLLDDHYTLRLLELQGNQRLYLVSKSGGRD